MLNRMQELIFPPGGSNIAGQLSPRAYQDTVKKLKAAGLINTIPPYNTFFKNVLNDGAAGEKNGNSSKVENVQK